MMPQPAEKPLLELPDRPALRAWLAENHATSAGVALAVGKKGGTATALTYDDAVEEALCFGWIDSTARRLDEHRYTINFTPRRPGGNWSRPNKVRVARLIAEGLMQPAGFAVIEAAKADGSWDLLTDVEALVIPDDLAATFAADPKAAAGWERMANSRKQMLLYAVVTAKRQETRARRIEQLLKAAREGLNGERN